MDPTTRHARAPEEHRNATAGAVPGPYRPAWWLPGGHAQTVGARLLRGIGGIAWQREVLETAGGVAVELDEAPGPADAPRVLLLHGLEGCSDSGYVVETARKLGRRGLRAVAMNFRPRSVEPRHPVPYHAGRTAELAHAVRTLSARSSTGRVGLVGFSLGGNVLLKFLAEEGADAARRVAAAAAVSVPFDLSATADRMERWPGTAYARFFLSALRRAGLELHRRFPDAVDRERVLAAGTVRAFDEAVTAPLHGFRDAEDYYRRASCGPHLHDVAVPCIVLQAADDPLVPAETVPLAAIRRNRWLVDGVVDRGGHVGFVEGASPHRASLWVEREAVRFLAAHLSRIVG